MKVIAATTFQTEGFKRNWLHLYKFSSPADFQYRDIQAGQTCRTGWIIWLRI